MFKFWKISQKISIFVFLVLTNFSLLGITNSASAGMFLPYGLDYGIGWFDANKTITNTEDDLMCWAATASNILKWGGWTTTTLNTEDKIFQNFQDHWTDQGGLMEFGWHWWFNGINDMQGVAGWSQVDVAGGGNHFPGLNFYNYYHRTWQDDLAMSAIANYLVAGYGVGIGIYGPGGHALTVWGFFYDDITLAFTDLIFTDSDDYNSSDGSKKVLWRTPVQFSGNKWYLPAYGNGWYIGEVQALAAIPEPSAFLLFGSGLIGFGIAARIRRKRS